MILSPKLKRLVLSNTSFADAVIGCKQAEDLIGNTYCKTKNTFIVNS